MGPVPSVSNLTHVSCFVCFSCLVTTFWTLNECLTLIWNFVLKSTPIKSPGPSFLVWPPLYRVPALFSPFLSDPGFCFYLVFLSVFDVFVVSCMNGSFSSVNLKMEFFQNCQKFCNFLLNLNLKRHKIGLI